MTREAQIAVGALLVGGALWWIVARNRAAAAPPAAIDDGSDRDPIADFLGVPQLCVDIAKSHPQAGGICAGLDGAWKAAKKIGAWVGDAFERCTGAVPSTDELVKSEAMNRALNGPCRAFTSEAAWINCPTTRRAPIDIVSPSSPANTTRAGICVSYVSGCAPLSFAPAAARCQTGTRIYGYGIHDPKVAAAAAARYAACIDPHGTARDRALLSSSTRARSTSTCQKPRGEVVDLRARFGEQIAQWFGGGDRALVRSTRDAAVDVARKLGVIA